MQAYTKETHLGCPANALVDDAHKSIDIAANVLQYEVRLDTDKVGSQWTQRDTAIEMVVPVTVLEQLGKDVHAGQLVSVWAAAYPDVRHIARIIPADVCQQPLVSAKAAQVMSLDQSTCLDAGSRPVALLSPILAFNLGIPYHLAQLMHGDDLSKWLHSKSNKITISTFGSSGPGTEVQTQYNIKTAWTPGVWKQDLRLAKHVGLAPVNKPEKAPPFNIVDHQDNLQAAIQAMQGGSPEQQQPKDEPEDKDFDQLQAAEAEQRDDEYQKAIQSFLSTPRLICLGDIIAVKLKTTPLLGPVQTLSNLHDKQVEKVAYLKVVQLSSSEPCDANEAPDHALLWVSHQSNTMLVAVAASDVPVGGETYLLRSPNEVEPAAASDSDSALPRCGRLGSEAYALLESRHVLAPNKLMTGLWRDMAKQMVPFLHPTAKGARGVDSRDPDGSIAMLARGPEGSGKATAVYAAAAAVGLSVLEMDCRSLSGGNPMDEAAPVNQLLHAIQQAREFGPVVLLLRRLERIFPPQPNASLVKRFADVLSQSTAAFCAPHVPEVTMSPGPDDPPPDPNEPPPLRDLPWTALTTLRRSDGTRVALPPGVTQRHLRMAHERYTPGVLMVVGTTSKVAELPVPLRRCFTLEYVVSAGDEKVRAEVLQHMLGDTCGMNGDDLKSAAQSTAGFLPCDLGATACDAVLDAMLTKLQRERHAGDVGALVHGQVGVSHIARTLDEVRKRVALDIGAPKIPKVKWDDVGGLEHVKKAIMDTIELPLKYRDLFSSGLKRRSGVLLYGPPGTGKTLIAKAVATECSINFMSVKGPELINMYVGESEKNVRDVFEQARKAQPCVLFFDELDSLAPRRGTGMDSSHVSDRIVAQLLAELDGIGGGRNDVYVIGATNRPDLLDNALMRPGRLDVLLYVGVDRNADAKLKVMKALTRKFNVDAGVDFPALAAEVPQQCTGADMYGVCADAWMHSLRRTIAELENCGRVSNNQDEGADLDDVEVVVTMQDFVDALSKMVPSLTVADLDRYDKLQDQYASPGGGGQGGASAAAGASAAESASGSAPGQSAPRVGKGPALPPRQKATSK